MRVARQSRFHRILDARTRSGGVRTFRTSHVAHCNDNPGMNFQRFAIPLLLIGLLAFAWRQYGWPGVAAVAGGLVMWLLLHFTRLMTVMQRAAKRPIGHVASAVMLNAKLKPGVTLMHVIAMTRALGERLSAEGEEPEVFRWTDGGGSSVTGTFRAGRLESWALLRPEPASETAPLSAPEAAP